jgi:hypothetical protein
MISYFHPQSTPVLGVFPGTVKVGETGEQMRTSLPRTTIFMKGDHDYSEPEHLLSPRGAILIAATGAALGGDGAGVYRGFGPLIIQLCGEPLPRGRLPADDVTRFRLMDNALDGLRVPRLLRQRITAARARPGIAPWLDAMQTMPWLLDLLMLGRERL